MKRFMQFGDILSLIESGLVQPGLIIKSVADDKELILNELILTKNNSRLLGFCDNERKLVQTINYNSVWELTNVDFNINNG